MAKASEKAPVLVWGRHTIDALLSQQESGHIPWDLAKRSRCRLFVWKSSSTHSIEKDFIYNRALQLGWRIDICLEGASPWPLDKNQNSAHQKYCVSLPEMPTSSLEIACDILRESQKKGDCSYLGLVLDHIEDPHNFGAIIRTAAFLGIKFIVYPKDRQSGLTGTVFKASAGGAFMLHMIPVVNLSRALVEMKTAGGWAVGGSLSESALLPKAIPFDRPLLLVVGNEGKGISRECSKQLDYEVKIPGGQKTLESLNVSVATGILLYSHLSEAPL